MGFAFSIMTEFIGDRQYSFDSLEDTLIKEYFERSTREEAAERIAEFLGTYACPFIGGFLAGLSRTSTNGDMYQAMLLCIGPGVISGITKGWISCLEKDAYRIILSNDKARHNLVAHLADDPYKFRKVRRMKQHVDDDLYVIYDAGNTGGIGLVLAGVGLALGQAVRGYM